MGNQLSESMLQPDSELNKLKDELEDKKAEVDGLKLAVQQ